MSRILNQWTESLITEFTLGNFLFGFIKLIKNTHTDKYVYTGYGIGFNLRSKFSLPDVRVGKNVIIFGANMGSSVHTDNKGKNALILGEGATQRLDDTTITEEAKYPRQYVSYVLRLHYNGSNSSLFVNITKIYKSKTKDFEIKDYTMCLGNALKDFSINNMKGTGLKGTVKFFSVDFNPIDTNDILYIHQYLMERTSYSIMFGLIKKIFIGFLTSIVSPSNRMKCVSLSNQQ